MKILNNRRIVRITLVACAASAVCLPIVAQVLRAAGPTTAPSSAPSVTAPAATAPATAVPTSQPTDPNHVIISVNGVNVTIGDFDAFIADLPPREQAMARGPGRRELAEYLVKMKLLSTEAEKRKLQDSAKVKRQMSAIRDQVLANALVTDVQDSIDDAAIKKYYDEHKAQLDRVAARHILIRTPDSKMPAAPGKPALTEEQAKARADDIYKRLKAGEDFAKLAREYSDDSGSAAEGGDLGSFTRGRMVAPFEQAAFALKEGEISQPVKSPFGWHIIQVTEKFDSPQKLADQIRQILGPEKMTQLVNSLRKSNKVELDEAYLGPPLPEPELPLPGAPGAEGR